MASARSVWTDFGVVRVMGSKGVGTVWAEAGWFVFVIWAFVLPDVLGQTVFTWG